MPAVAGGRRWSPAVVLFMALFVAMTVGQKTHRVDHGVELIDVHVVALWSFGPLAPETQGLKECVDHR